MFNERKSKENMILDFLEALSENAGHMQEPTLNLLLKYFNQTAPPNSPEPPVHPSL